MSCLNLRQGIQDGRMGLGENVEFTLGHGEFELLMELSGRNVQEVGVCGCGCVGEYYNYFEKDVDLKVTGFHLS